MADKMSKIVLPIKNPSTGAIVNKEFEFGGSDNLGTAAYKDVPSSGNASSSQVVMGNDSRLSDSRNAKDVPAWAKASSKPTYTASEVGAIATSTKGAANGVAELDSNGKVPSSQLPSYVDDVLEYDSQSAFPSTGETGKIYVAKDTNKSYRWTGSAYSQIKGDLALGETSSTAYRGDRGKTAYDHSQSTHARTDATKTEASSTNGNIKINGTETKVYTHPGSGTNPHGTTKSDVGLANVGNFKAVSTEASQGLTDTEKANARANIGAGTSSFSGSYNDLTNKPTIPTVNNATLTIQKNGTTVKTFTANASSNVTANITVPTKTSELTNDSSFTSNTGTVTKVSTGAGLTGGDVTTTGTIKANLLSETKLTNASAAATETANRVYPVALDKNGKLAVNVPWTDNNTDSKVSQTATTTSADYEVLFSSTADNTTRTEGARKNSNLKFNPSTGNLQTTKLNGVDVGNSPKFTDTDTKNTAGSTDTSSKIFLIGATSQAANPQTYSHDTAYVGTDGCLYSGGKKTLTALPSHNHDDRYYTETEINSIVDGLQANFQDGVDDVYDAVVAKGSTPASKSLSDVIQGIEAIPSGGIEKFYDIHIKPSLKSKEATITVKTWTGLTYFFGQSIWTDGSNIYYSYDSTQYVLDKSTSTWSKKTWSGLTSFDASNIWTDGENIYFSEGSTQYVLNKSTSTWSKKTWSGFTSLYGMYIWTDGENIYFSEGSTQYVLNKSTSTWNTKAWSGLTYFFGQNIWTDGENIYFSSGSTQYVLNKSTSTWSKKTWSGFTSLYGMYIWTDGSNIYLSMNNPYGDSGSYILDKSTSTWSTKTWTGFTQNFNGSCIWTDGSNIYISEGYYQCIFQPNVIRPISKPILT